MYDTGVLIRCNLLFPDLPAVIITAGLRYEDLDYPVAAPMVDDNLSPCTHDTVKLDRQRIVPMMFILALPSATVCVLACVVNFLWRGSYTNQGHVQ